MPTLSEHLDTIDAINPLTPRVEGLLQRFLGSPVRICPERSRLASESWKETQGDPLDLRRAKLFKRICDEIPISIFDGELIVGSQTPFPRGVGLQLDFNPVVGLELESGDRRTRAENSVGILPDDALRAIARDTHFWEGISPGETMLDAIDESLGSDFRARTYSCTRSYGKFTNFAPDADYAKVLAIGLDGIVAEIDAELDALTFTSREDGPRHSFLKAARISCEAMWGLAHRYSQLARKLARVETAEARRRELEAIAEVCARVPQHPARTFQEALQCVRLIHLGLYLEDGNGAGALLGRLDQSLYPFYARDLERGVLDPSGAAELLAAFWIKVAATDRIPPGYVKTAGAGYVQTRAILGGVDRSGDDACNDLTYLILHVAGALQVDVPIYLRWHSGMDRRVMDKAVLTNIAMRSEPAFHNDEQIIPGLVSDGASLEDARDYVLHGCSHPFPYGSCYGTVFFINGAKVLELVMFNGVDPVTGARVGPETGDPSDFGDIDRWISAFLRQWSDLYDLVLAGSNLGESVQSQVYSQPFASALTADCIQNGRGVHAGGTRYPRFTGDIQNKVYADVADSMAAIQHLVYERGVLTVSEIVDACAADFAGADHQRVRALLLGAPKFGNDSGSPENIYRTLNDRVAALSRSRIGYLGFPKRDTRVGGAVHMAQGRDVGALPNGRRAGEPLSDGGISPVAGCDVAGPTVTLRSVARALDFSTNRSAVLNQKIPRHLLRTPEERSRLIDVIETYFEDLCGYQIQWNICDAEDYIAAKESPSDYRNLLVRVGGYSAYFVELDSDLQDQIIARTEQGLD